MESSPVRRIQRVRHDIQRRELRVIDVQPKDQRFVAITFQAESLKTFVSASFDDHVKLMLPDGQGGLIMRDYTPRRFELARGELVIEFALHGHGPLSDWARQARPGQTLTIGGPRGSMVVPMDYDWHLLVGDDSAWPAIQRRVEELPAAARVHVLLQMPQLPTVLPASAAQIHWQLAVDAPALEAALRELVLPAGEGFVWCAGEARVMAGLRDVLIQHKGHPKEAMKVAAYWKEGAAAFHERLDSEGP